MTATIQRSQIFKLAGLAKVSRVSSLRMLEAHVSVHLQRQIDKLKKLIMTLGTMVEESLEGAIRAFDTRDVALAQQIITADENVNAMEVDIEEECLHTLALHQPVAFDMRFIVAVLKINNELERIGDLATNIAKQAQFLTHKPRVQTVPYDLPRMANTVRNMLRKSLDALVNIDADTAKAVIAMDDQVDAIHRQMYKDIEQAIQQNHEQAAQMIHLLSISRQMERIADHAVNIAEDVLYMALGEILRHR